MAVRKNYFGVGGGSRRFLSVVEKDAQWQNSLRALCLISSEASLEVLWLLAQLLKLQMAPLTFERF
ncbi:unnamed protein product [Ilex paraguariensis]|uniref:Uncharacterized protein n=1 Tax=Ilex paraguariensis TaxID=185542 RepID=A0ABC8RYL2_9AQUA